jgi:uncharacterized protein YndB with AHSA1/START domain
VTGHAVELSPDGTTVRAWVELPGVERHEALEAWTNREELKGWWGGELETELERGEPYVVHFAGLGQTMCGRVLGYEPGARLAFTWEWDHAPDAPMRRVDIAAVDAADGSRLEIEHGPYGGSEEERAEAAGSQEGWNHFLPRLAAQKSVRTG